MDRSSRPAPPSRRLYSTSLFSLAVVVVAWGATGCAARLQPTTTVPQRMAETSAENPPEIDPTPQFAEGSQAAADADLDAADLAPSDAPAEESEGVLAGEIVTDSPLDQLGTVWPELTGEELARSRDLVEEQVPTFDIPIETNDRVLAWVERYTNQYRTPFVAGLARSGRYMGMFRRIFAEEGLPQDLVYMAHVESGYKTNAYSRAHARGIFQFIASTARRYGLRVDSWVDERSDPEKSARAAARYMKKLYADFGDWYLALAAYNAGEGKISRAIERSGERDFWGIARTRHIHTETKNHVPAILAAVLLSKSPSKYGLEVEFAPPVSYETITVDGAADMQVLARCAGTDTETLRDLNPALRRQQTPPDGRTDVRVPSGTSERASLALAAIPPGERVLYAIHHVRQGDTLSAISRHYGVDMAAIQQANQMQRRTLIHVNQNLRIPTNAPSGRPGIDSFEVGSSVPEVVSYRVRSGDTLFRISKRFGTTPEAIASASGIRTDRTLRVGDRLRVVRGVRSASEAKRVALGPLAVSTPKVSKSLQHTVKRGDTLWGIATIYETTVRALCALNSISPSTVLRPGARLTVGIK